MSEQALLIKGAQNCGSKVWDLHVEQLGHVGHRGRGRRGFRYSLQTPPLREASVKKEKKKKKVCKTRWQKKKRSDGEGEKRESVKDERLARGRHRGEKGKLRES